jgi:GH25 family lysozyme M1 (1,4-beta-N-acetylmuramidase)
MTRLRWALGLVVLIAVAAIGLGRAAEFEEPWKAQDAAIVIDPYAGNSIDWEKLATDPKVVGILHKATEGAAKDRLYAARREEAKKRGYRWGSYHLGRPGDPIQQADFYLETASPADDEVMALDVDGLDATFISLEDARRWLVRVREKTGRYPMVYGNDSVIRAISTKYGQDGVFSRTRLWYARFKKTISDFPKGTWPTYTFWQFSSEINCSPTDPASCLYRVPGTGYDMDIDVYNGTAADLKRNWPFVIR